MSIEKIKNDFSLLRKARKTIKQISPKYLSLCTINASVNAIYPFVSLHISTQIINLLTVSEEASSIITHVVMLIISTLIFEVLSHFLSKEIKIAQILFDVEEEYYLNLKGFEMDFQQIESSEIRLLRQKITDNRMWGGLKKTASDFISLYNNLCQIIIALFLFCNYLFVFSKQTISAPSNSRTIIVSVIFAVFLTVGLVATSIITKNGVKKRKINIEDVSSSKSFLDYYINEYLSDIKTGKDIRIYEQNKLILNSLQTRINQYLGTIKKTQNEQWNFSLKNALIVVILSGMSYIYIGQKVLLGSIGIGNILEFSGIITRAINAMSQFTSNIIEFLSNISFLRAFYDYIEMDSTMNMGTQKIEFPKNNATFEFNNVSFKYPGKDELILHNVNLKINCGKKIAIVGMNGSGKSTFIKLLCRLYDPISGSITVNNVDIKSIDYNEYLSLFSVVFQDFKIFALTVAENVATTDNYNEKNVSKVLNTVGLKEVSRQIETVVYKDFDVSGIELSGGEAQKIAIARALYKDAPILVLDEPTASLDPVAESEIYELINQIAKEKTIIFISHRLSSCKFCDEIIVFDSGEIVQQGTHEQLLEEKDGKYSSLWNAQAKHYSNKKN